MPDERGRATAYPPTTRYRTLRSFSNRMNSLKSGWSVIGPVVVFPSDLLESGEALLGGLVTPVRSIGRLIVQWNLPNRLFHGHQHQSVSLWQRSLLRGSSPFVLLDSPRHTNACSVRVWTSGRTCPDDCRRWTCGRISLPYIHTSLHPHPNPASGFGIKTNLLKHRPGAGSPPSSASARPGADPARPARPPCPWCPAPRWA
jgi:hypothetical protein